MKVYYYNYIDLDRISEKLIKDNVKKVLNNNTEKLILCKSNNDYKLYYFNRNNTRREICSSRYKEYIHKIIECFRGSDETDKVF